MREKVVERALADYDGGHYLEALRHRVDKAVVVPNAGGSTCNYIFQDHLGLPTIWIPHSYSGCCQHAPNEHILGSITREAMAITAALYWDLGESPPRAR